MQGVEIAHMNAALAAALKAFYDLGHSTVGDALRPVDAYGKDDTLEMDSGPEITIWQELRRYDTGAVVISEEIGSKGITFNDTFNPNDTRSFRTVFICDPTDRSNQFKEFLGKLPKQQKIREVLNDPETVAKWEKEYGAPASISGSTSAISCVRRGIPIFAVIINYITQQLAISCAAGNRIIQLSSERPDILTLPDILARGKEIIFPCLDGNVANMKKFVTFLGDVKKTGYLENFRDSGFVSKEQAADRALLDEFFAKHLHYGKPGGPSRALYLSALQPRSTPMGFVLANGEKIGEWIHWLSFVQYVRSQSDDSQPALVLYEVSQDRPWTKNGVLMATHANYSVFREYDGKLFVDTNWLLQQKPSPSQVRATLIIAPYDNRWVISSAVKSGYRPIRF
ncbi:MAG: hypothetical protein NTY04_00110 [Candidatus Staskawiczbacteria bacterium]|nr:hypothetical protein [Candidatus Staskawiczbacteria bacterium]